jgi:hemolysin type calcium-binding protein
MIGGSAGDTFLEGRSRNGSDTMVSGNRAAGDAGPDMVDYRARRSPVRADLEGDRDDGAPGERDRIGPGVGSLVGGDGPDVLVGGPGNNTLDSSDGRDILRGGGGDDDLLSGVHSPEHHERDRDRVFGGPGADGIATGNGADVISAGSGRDWIDSGPGDDRVGLWDADQDLAECGDGRDTVQHDGMDLLLLACERHGPRHAQVATAVAWTDAGDYLILGMACPLGHTSDCAGQIAVDPGAPVPRTVQPFTQPPGSLRFLRIPLAGRSYWDPVPPLEPAVVEISSTDPRGRTQVRLVPLRGLHDVWRFVPLGLLDHVDPPTDPGA